MKETGEVTLESEYEKVKEIDIDNWEPIRGKIQSISPDIYRWIQLFFSRTKTMGRATS